MDPIVILTAGVASGTVLLFAAIGEIFAERAGVLNLGVEGMMFVGAVAGISSVVATGNPWLALLLAMLAGGLLALVHGIVSIHFQGDQIVSGLALTFLGTGLALVLGEGLAGAGGGGLLPRITIPVLSGVPIVGPIFFTAQSVLVYVGYVLVPVSWYWINHTRPGLHLRAVGEYPTAADAVGVDVYRTRYAYVVLGGILAGLAGATITLVVNPGWSANQTTSGQGWIAIGLVIFARWSPFRAMIGAYAYAALQRTVLDIQGPADFFGIANPFFRDHNLTFFLDMVPFIIVILVLVVGSREAARKRLGAPAALGTPYVRGERGH